MADENKSSDSKGERVLDVTEQVGPIADKEPAKGGRLPGMPRSTPKGFFTP